MSSSSRVSLLTIHTSSRSQQVSLLLVRKHKTKLDKRCRLSFSYVFSVQSRQMGTIFLFNLFFGFLDFFHHLTVETKAISHPLFLFFSFPPFLRMTGPHISWGSNKLESPNNKTRPSNNKRKFEYRSWGLKTPKLQATDMSCLREWRSSYWRTMSRSDSVSKSLYSVHSGSVFPSSASARSAPICS